MRILIPIPARDFDPSEVAVSWKVLRAAGHHLVFATPAGERGEADPLMLSGEGLDPWGWMPGVARFRLLGLLLRANHAARAAYRQLERDDAFRAPLRYADLDAAHFDALLLPGGHARGIRTYLESTVLQGVVADFFDASKPVAAICHGVVLAARSVSKRSGRSVLFGRRTTALTWQLERSAWNLTRFFARFWDPDYYRTYRESAGEPPGHRGVEAEVKRCLADPADFLDVPRGTPDAWQKSSGLFRDRIDDARPAFVVRDGDYVSARWPGDVHTFALVFAEVLVTRESVAAAGKRVETVP